MRRWHFPFFFCLVSFSFSLALWPLPLSKNVKCAMHNKLDVAEGVKKKRTWVENMAKRKQNKSYGCNAMAANGWARERKRDWERGRAKAKAAGHLHISSQAAKWSPLRWPLMGCNGLRKRSRILPRLSQLAIRFCKGNVNFFPPAVLQLDAYLWHSVFLLSPVEAPVKVDVLIC